MGACIRKRVVYDMSCKRFQFFVNVEALHKIGLGQPMVIIYKSFVDLESQMNHAKFQDHWTSGYKDF